MANSIMRNLTLAFNMTEPLLINPGNAPQEDPLFADKMTLFVNEPDSDVHPNLKWVENLDEFRVEYYTAIPIKAGDEVTICYGGAYMREGYTSDFCESRWQEVPYYASLYSRHAVTYPLDVPYCPFTSAE